MASLLSMPLELLLLITPELTTETLGSLRLTCKRIEQALFDEFAQEFFQKRQFSLTHMSLQTLVDISKHPNLSKRLTHVFFTTEEYTAPRAPFPSEEKCARYIRGMQEQISLFNTGVDREMLTEAFQNLSNLKTVGIRDYGANGLGRLGPRACWNSYGSPTVYQETGERLRNTRYNSLRDNDRGNNPHSRLFNLVIYALGRAGSTPQSIEVIFRSGGCLYDQAFNIPSYALSTVRPVLDGLRTLFLTLTVEQPSHRWPGVNVHSTLHGDEWKFRSPSLGRFLSHTSNLTHLRLNFKQTSRFDAPFLLWLAEPVPTSTDGSNNSGDNLAPPPIALPHLKRLDLGFLLVNPDDIVAVVEKFSPTLEHLSLWKIQLQKADVNPPNPRACNYWSALFSAMSQLPSLHLQSLEVGEAKQRPYDPLHEDLVWFKTRNLNAGLGAEEEEEEGEVVKSTEEQLKGCQARLKLQGADTMALLAKMARKVVVPWEPENRDEDSEGDDSSEDEHMDDGD